MNYFCSVIFKGFHNSIFNWIILNRLKIKYLKGVLIPLFFIISLSFDFLYSQEDQILAGKKLFNTHCAACHKVKKKAIGPAMRGVSEKYDREWLYSWIKNSAAMIKSGDPKQLLFGKSIIEQQWMLFLNSPMLI